MCGGDDNIEHIYILPSIWLYSLQFEEFSDEKFENIQNANCTPIKVFFEENSDSWHPKTHGPRNVIQSFYLTDIIQKCGKKNNIHLQSFKMLLQEKGQDHLIKKMITIELLLKHFIIHLYNRFTSCLHMCVEVGIDNFSKLFLNLGVVSLSEDDEEVSLLSLSL